MSSYSRVFDERNVLCGLWMDDAEEAKDKLAVSMLFIHVGAPDRLPKEALLGNYRIVPNRVNSQGGFFVMIGTELAPGEAADTRGTDGQASASSPSSSGDRSWWKRVFKR